MFGGASPVAVASVQAAGVGMMLHHPAVLNPCVNVQMRQSHNWGHPVPLAGFQAVTMAQTREDARKEDFGLVVL